MQAPSPYNHKTVMPNHLGVNVIHPSPAFCNRNVCDKYAILHQKGLDEMSDFRWQENCVNASFDTFVTKL